MAALAASSSGVQRFGPMAADAADPVGVRTMNFADGAGGAFEARIWYPTRGGTPGTHGGSRIRLGYLAVRDGAIAIDGRAPIVFLLHGSGGSSESMAWIALGVAARGAIVVSADHPASAQGDPERMSVLDIWEQPGDVSRMLEQLLRSEFARYIDPGRISVVGFSLGGASAMLLAGARVEMDRFRAFCKTHDDGACSAFRRHFGSMDAAYFARAGQSYADVRVKAAVAIAPAFTEAMTAESLRTLGAPVLVVAGERDQQLPPATHIRPMLDHLRPPSLYHEVPGAQHFSFLPLCSPGAIAILAESNESLFAAKPATGHDSTFMRKRSTPLDDSWIATDSWPAQARASYSVA